MTTPTARAAIARVRRAARGRLSPIVAEALGELLAAGWATWEGAHPGPVAGAVLIADGCATLSVPPVWLLPPKG